MNTLFLDRVLVLLAQGSFTATYKYSLLLALIDLCVEGTAEGLPPTSVTTHQVAERLVGLYWPHTRPYAEKGQLTQNRGGQAGILKEITAFRQRVPGHTPEQARRADPAAYARMLFEVEFIAAFQPIPRLQLIGGQHRPFLYQIQWTIEQNSGARIEDLPLLQKRHLRDPAFDNRLVFLSGVPDQLVALSAVLRPLIQRQWSDLVARINGLPEHHLEGFLFGAERVDLGPVRQPLMDLQDHRCFYCGRAVSPGDAHVDHFLPWSRVPLDDLGNLVVADSRCNLSKRDFLVGGEIVSQWSTRDPEALDRIRRDHDWDYNPDRTRAAASVVYRQLSPGVPLWRGKDLFRDLDEAEHATILAALRSGR